jgi:hypothetical protein
MNEKELFKKICYSSFVHIAQIQADRMTSSGMLFHVFVACKRKAFLFLPFFQPLHSCVMLLTHFDGLSLESVLLTNQSSFRIADFTFPKSTSETLKFALMLTVLMALYVFFHNINGFLENKATRFSFTLSKEVFANPTFFENSTFITNFPFS